MSKKKAKSDTNETTRAAIPSTLIAKAPPSLQDIVFRYRRSNFHRVVHVDGVYGGPASAGNIHLAIYSEHYALPEEQTYGLTAAGIPQDPPKSQVGGTGLLREVEVSLIFTLPMAYALRGWLESTIKNAEGNITELSKQVVENKGNQS